MSTAHILKLSLVYLKAVSIKVGKMGSPHIFKRVNILEVLPYEFIFAYLHPSATIKDKQMFQFPYK